MSAVNIGKRTLLLVAYAIVSSAVILGFWSVGVGITIALFGSWGFLLLYHVEAGPILFAITYLLYLSILCYAGTAQARQTKMKYPFLSFVGHSIGCILVIIRYNHEVAEQWSRPGTPTMWTVAGILVPISVVVLYILADWSLAKGGKRPSAPSLSAGPPTAHRA